MHPHPLLRSILAFAASLLFALQLPQTAIASSLNGDGRGEDLSSEGWRLWPDKTAAWMDDRLFLPEEVVLSKIPVLPPTGGWAALSGTQGIAVSLPSSVEEHFWAAFRGDAADGIYKGVSWWWRSFSTPELKPGQRLVIRFRSARLRAEVYCNQKLCGYNVITEVPFEADVTDAVKPGQLNQLAVRITNPGGSLAWNDWGCFSWGKTKVPTSRGIGGLDAGIILEVRDPVSVNELAVLNRPKGSEVSLVSTVANSGSSAYTGPLKMKILKGGTVAWEETRNVQIPAGSQCDVSHSVELPKAVFWDLDCPELYTAEAEIPGQTASKRSVQFGFRWFAAEGIGSNALLRLNGKRIVLKSAISWGWWAPTGIFPSDALARKEVTAAKALGLNCLNFHRNIGPSNVLDQQDQLGLLRYEESGAGINAFSKGPQFKDPSTPPGPEDITGKGGEPKTFEEKYQAAKILRMVRRDRSHPSLVLYCLQNEESQALDNPRIFWLFERIREIDPSRTVYLHSGVEPNNQVVMLPYTPVGSFCLEDGNGYSGWRDQHTVGGPGNYRDELYKDKDTYSHHLVNPKEIIVWGEMLGAGMPDDHEKIVSAYRDGSIGARTGYDLQLHENALAAYDAFLDKWNFRSAFPTASSLFRSVGAKGYFFWQKVMENGRMSDDNDALVISGWESTHVENHAGLVDAHRNLRADPAILKKAMEPEVLVVRPKRLVLKPGEVIDVDVHLINETNRSGPQRLTISARNSEGIEFFHDTRAVKATGGDVFGEPLSTGFTFTPAVSGMVTITGALRPENGTGKELTNSVEVLVVDATAGTPLMPRIAVCEPDRYITKALTEVFQVAPLDDTHLGDSALDAIVVGVGSTWKHRYAGSGDIVPNKTDMPNLYKRGIAGEKGTIGIWSGFAPGPVTIELRLAEMENTAPEKRVFDFAVNDVTVMQDIDIFRESGGRGVPLIKKATVETTNGVIKLSIPAIKKGQAFISGLKIVDSRGKTLAIVFQEQPCTEKNGTVWQPLETVTDLLTETQWRTILGQVKTNGIRLVVWPDKVIDLMSLVRRLEGEQVLRVLSYKDEQGTSDGYLSKARASWMGSWYFARKHWLFDGLPVDSVLGWPYQLAQSSNGEGGLLIDKVPEYPMEVMAGYGRDHEAAVGVGACVIHYGKGLIVIGALPGMQQSLTKKNGPIAEAVALRLLGNALRPAGPTK